MCKTPSDGGEVGGVGAGGAGNARCRLDVSFGTPTLVAGLGPVSPGLGLSPDERTIYVARTTSFVRAVGAPPIEDSDVVVATRATAAPTDAFGPAMSVAGVDDTDDQWAPDISEDGLSIFYVSMPAPSGVIRIFSARRSSPTESFGMGQALGELFSGQNDGDPFIAADGRSLFFASMRDGGAGAYDLYVATRANTEATFDAPLRMAALDSAAFEFHPVLSHDQLTLFFSSDRADGGALGGADIWVSRRARLQDPFGAPQNVSELNSPADDYPGWVSPDGCAIYFTSTRSIDGSSLVFQARRGS